MANAWDRYITDTNANNRLAADIAMRGADKGSALAIDNRNYQLKASNTNSIIEDRSRRTDIAERSTRIRDDISMDQNIRTQEDHDYKLRRNEIKDARADYKYERDASKRELTYEKQDDNLNFYINNRGEYMKGKKARLDSTVANEQKNAIFAEDNLKAATMTRKERIQAAADGIKEKSIKASTALKVTRDTTKAAYEKGKADALREAKEANYKLQNADREQQRVVDNYTTAHDKFQWQQANKDLRERVATGELTEKEAELQFKELNRDLINKAKKSKLEVDDAQNKLKSKLIKENLTPTQVYARNEKARRIVSSVGVDNMRKIASEDGDALRKAFDEKDNTEAKKLINKKYPNAEISGTGDNRYIDLDGAGTEHKKVPLNQALIDALYSVEKSPTSVKERANKVVRKEASDKTKEITKNIGKTASSVEASIEKYKNMAKRYGVSLSKFDPKNPPSVEEIRANADMSTKMSTNWEALKMLYKLKSKTTLTQADKDVVNRFVKSADKLDSELESKIQDTLNSRKIVDNATAIEIDPKAKVIPTENGRVDLETALDKAGTSIKTIVGNKKSGYKNMHTADYFNTSKLSKAYDKNFKDIKSQFNPTENILYIIPGTGDFVITDFDGTYKTSTQDFSGISRNNINKTFGKGGVPVVGGFINLGKEILGNTAGRLSKDAMDAYLKSKGAIRVFEKGGVKPSKPFKNKFK